jgi:hypothetical protein
MLKMFGCCDWCLENLEKIQDPEEHQKLISS